MFDIFTPQELFTTNSNAALEKEGLQQEQDKIKTQQKQTTDNQITSNFNQPTVKLNLLDTLDFIAEKITKIKEPESYLQARTDFLQILKLCQKRLEKYEENTFIPLLEKEQTDNLRFGRYEITYRPSKKTVIDPDKLKAQLLDPSQISIFLKEPEFKTLPECRRLVFNLGIEPDVYTIKQGKKPILNIIDTNIVKRQLEDKEQEELEEVEEGS